MKYSKVVAIFNIDDFALLSDELIRLNIPGVSVSKVEGYGDYVNEFHEYGFSESMKIEIYTHATQAVKVAQRLAQKGGEMTDGGGVVAIEPVSELYNVKKLQPT